MLTLYIPRYCIFYTVHAALFGSEMNLISVWLDWGKRGIIQNYGGEIL